MCRLTLETCLQMDICAYHIARRASAYKWFFLVFFYKHHPHSICNPCSAKKRKQKREIRKEKGETLSSSLSLTKQSTRQLNNQLVYLSTRLLVNLTISAHLHRQRNLLMIRVFEDVQMACRLVRIVFRV